MSTKVKKLYEDAIIPTKGSASAAGWDLYAHLPSNTTMEIKPHETVKIGTGVAVSLPDHTFGAIAARSGLATKQGLAPANKLGIVDEDYRGEIIVALHNHSNETRYVENEDRIAQLIIIPYIPVNLEIVDELEQTNRGDGGFGSSGE